MKKTIIYLVAFFMLTATRLFAGNDPNIPARLEQSFVDNFPEATEIVWQKQDDINIADFKENGVRHFAYFDDNARLLGVIRYITTDQMSFHVVSELKREFGDFGKANAIEISITDGETYYYLNVIYKAKVKTVKVYPSGASEFVKAK